MNKKSSLWISAVLYIALGVLIITLILSAGMPLIDKLKDQNVFAQTKKLMHTLDQNIRQVANEGPGSKRYLSPFEINQGSLDLEKGETSDSYQTITWSMITNNKLMEPTPIGGDPFTIREGNLIQWLDETKNKDEYLINIKLEYADVTSLELGSIGTPISGKYSLTISHTSRFDSINGDVPIISLEFT